MAETERLIEELVRATGAASLVERAGATVTAPDGIPFRALFASVGRRLGAEAGSTPMAPPALASSSRAHWSLADWTRLWLVLRALEHVPPSEASGFVLRTFEAGELGEQESVLRTLALLPEPARFTETGVAACRTNAKSVFEAIACDNPFPAAHFPELAFNQLVMKAVFIEAPVARIEGLAARRTPELRRMARDYASERRAASRPVPADVALVLGEVS